MPLTLTRNRAAGSRPLHLAGADRQAVSSLDAASRRWIEETGFDFKAGKLLLLPGRDGEIGGALLGIGKETAPDAALLAGALARDLPSGDWHFAAAPGDPDLVAVALRLGGYRFTRYGAKAGPDIRIEWPEGADVARCELISAGVSLARDLINTPASDMGPEALERAARELAGRHGATVSVIAGEALLEQDFPMIHAVGRAAAEAPRLIDLAWGPATAPRLTLVGKGVCFDTGGLDIKPSSGMLLMKKDMGGAANVLGLASMIMEAKIAVRLRVLIPAVENAISAGAFRPGDILKSRKGMTVEIGNTDAEGRLVLADALALADEEAPDLLIDMATLTGAARVALGPQLPPFFTGDEAFAASLSERAAAVADPMWRLPLWKPYAEGLSSRIADIGNVTSDGFAGAITAALFLSRFVEKAAAWAHFDIYAWNPKARPHAPVGGEAQCIRAMFEVVAARYRK
jgi:leucyl aminopeptidase